MLEFSEQIKRLKPFVLFYKVMNPRYARCVKCGLPWSDADPKMIHPLKRRGIFSVCEYCWDRTNLNDLFDYHTITYNKNAEVFEYIYPNGYRLEHVLVAVRKEYIISRGINNIRKEKLEKLMENDKRIH